MQEHFRIWILLLAVIAVSLFALLAPAFTRAAQDPPVITLHYPDDFLESTNHDVVFSATVDGGVFIDPPQGSQYSCVLGNDKKLITCTVTQNIYSADDAIDIEARSPSGVSAFTGPIRITTIDKTLGKLPTPTASGASSVLFLPGIEGSRLYYRDVLGAEHQIWEPDLFTDIPYLAMNSDGTSTYDLYTKDIIDSTYGNIPAEHVAALHAVGAESLGVYDGFETFIDGLVTSKTIKEWRAYPYDWRYDVRDIVANGTMTKQRDGSVARIHLVDVLKDMASKSVTKKVTIVGHSNGGLLAKALASALGSDAARYIDRIILIGSPQWGTPYAIGALLHADNFAGTPSLILDPLQAREVASGMPGSYNLLPSPAYFAHATAPAVTFDANGVLSHRFSEQFTSALTSFSSLADFLTEAAGLDTYIGSTEDIHAPIQASSALLEKALNTHDELDSWTPPPGIKITTIIGWGQETVSSITYRDASKAICTDIGFTTQACQNVPTLRHEAITTEDGDGTVLSISAAGSVPDTLYFDAARFRADRKGNILHGRLALAKPIQSSIKSILADEQASDPYISAKKPALQNRPLTIISSHSPVNILATDAAGRETGLVPIPGTDFSGVKEEIPGSSVQILGDEKYIYVPKGLSYRVAVTGYAVGNATIEIGNLQTDGAVQTLQSFDDIEVTASMRATLIVPQNVASPATLSIDHDGDGKSDEVLAPTAVAPIETSVDTPPIDSPDTPQEAFAARSFNQIKTRSAKVSQDTRPHTVIDAIKASPETVNKTLPIKPTPDNQQSIFARIRALFYAIWRAFVHFVFGNR